MNRVLSAALVLAVSVSACGDDSEPQGPTGSGNPPPAAQEVAVTDNRFTPSSASIEAGETVRWSWEGAEGHNVTFVETGMGTSGTQSDGTFSQTFSAEGAYQYYCSIHGSPASGMRGSVTVGEADLPPDTTIGGTGY